MKSTRIFFTCELGSVPLKYLGLLIYDVRIRNKFWKVVIEKIEKRCACWQERLLSIAGRITLVRPRLTSIPLFMMSLYPIPMGIRKKEDFFRVTLVWQANEDNKEYHLVNWKTCCMPKKQGGLGILNLELLNKTLLAKWFWKLKQKFVCGKIFC